MKVHSQAVDTQCRRPCKQQLLGKRHTHPVISESDQQMNSRCNLRDETCESSYIDIWQNNQAIRWWEMIDVIFDSSLRTTALKSEEPIEWKNNIEYWWLKSCTDCNGKRTQVRTEWTQVQTYVLLPYNQPSCVFLPYKHHKKNGLAYPNHGI